jgi:cytochrome c oxidase assembly protein subunit 15
MFLYPWSQMVGGIFYEHSHRLIGSAVGLFTIFLAFTLWLKESRPWLRWLGLIALAVVSIQGILGGLRVVLLQQTLAIIHACFAQAFFVLAASLVLFTAKEWQVQPVKKVAADAGRVQRLGVLTCTFLYAQVIFGALLRHTGERLEIHLLGAVLATIHVLLLTTRIRRCHADLPILVRSATQLYILLILQLALGAGAYFGKFTVSAMFLSPFVVVLATTHVVIGALMLVTCAMLTLRAYRLLETQSSAFQSQMLSEQAPV